MRPGRCKACNGPAVSATSVCTACSVAMAGPFTTARLADLQEQARHVASCLAAFEPLPHPLTAEQQSVHAELLRRSQALAHEIAEEEALAHRQLVDAWIAPLTPREVAS